MVVYALGDCCETVLDFRNCRRSRKGDAQAEHGEGAIRLDVEMALDQSSTPRARETMVNYENPGEPLFILTKIKKCRARWSSALADSRQGQISEAGGELVRYFSLLTTSGHRRTAYLS
jgi:hypothetical protein